MLPTRTLASTLIRSSRTAAAKTPVATSTAIRAASLHTARALAEEEKRGFLSRLNPFAKPTPTSSQSTTPAPTQDLNVEIEEEETAIPSWKSERQSLTAEQLEETIRSAAAPFVDTASSQYLNTIQLSDPKVMKACVVSTGQEIPSKDISSIHTLKDIFTVMQKLDQEAQSASSNPKGHVVAEWFLKNKESLPPNMVFIPYQKSKGVKAEDRRTTNKRFL
ncbi:hypothetical protein KVV02_000473 [Mortierella alpina]|uniref:Uncharacterized protein n=1 Tax=Mortierella alpina TaxID=64518 RepID=A0A9P7ZZA6_MORAP|nr:hypothetical protein KVV02_000473 [Mortierella alpina]